MPPAANSLATSLSSSPIGELLGTEFLALSALFAGSSMLPRRDHAACHLITKHVQLVVGREIARNIDSFGVDLTSMSNTRNGWRWQVIPRRMALSW